MQRILDGSSKNQENNYVEEERDVQTTPASWGEACD
jgi:hypothetical protein